MDSAGKITPRKIAKVSDGTGSTAGGVAVSVTEVMESEFGKVLSKHDEKWNSMFEKLVEYKVSSSNEVSLFAVRL